MTSVQGRTDKLYLSESSEDTETTLVMMLTWMAKAKVLHLVTPEYQVPRRAEAQPFQSPLCPQHHLPTVRLGIDTSSSY